MENIKDVLVLLYRQTASTRQESLLIRPMAREAELTGKGIAYWD